MMKMKSFASPDAFVASLDGWRLQLGEALRSGVRGAGAMEETIKWGNLVYLLNGPVLMIRAEDERVLFGFWRGQRLLEIEPRLKPGGKYEMATIELRKGVTVAPATVHRLVREAIALNQKAGNPQLDAKPATARRKTAASRSKSAASRSKSAASRSKSAVKGSRPRTKQAKRPTARGRR